MTSTDSDPKLMVRLNNVRLSFPHLFEPQRDENGKNPRFSAVFILDPEHEGIKPLNAAMIEAAKQKWPNKYKEIVKSLKVGNKLCLKPGELKADYDGFAGNMFVSAGNKTPVKIFGRDGARVSQEDSGIPYAGCFVNATMDIWAQDHPKHGKRINASLRGVQFVDDGEAFGGARVAADDEFGALEEGADDGAEFDTDDNDLL